MGEVVAGEVATGDERVARVEPEITDDHASVFSHGGQRYAVSVILPIKDPHPGYFAEAVTSIHDQTSPRWELVVVTEPAEQARIVEMLGYWAVDPRVQVSANRGQGLAGAVNTGMHDATSDFVGLLLGDDLWTATAVATLTDRIARYPDVDFFHSARRIVDDEGNPISSVHPARHDVTLDDFRTGAPVKHLLCWRRATGLAVGGLDERSASVGPDDFDFPWTMAEHGARFEAIDDCLYVYRDHRDGTRLTTHLSRRVHERELRRVFRKHGLDRRQTKARIQEARDSYLQQCLYRSSLDERLRRWFRRPPAVWRDSYR